MTEKNSGPDVFAQGVNCEFLDDATLVTGTGPSTTEERPTLVAGSPSLNPGETLPRDIVGLERFRAEMEARHFAMR